MSISIRPYYPQDIETVYQLFYHSVHQAAKKDYTPEQLATWAKPQRNTQRWDEGLNTQLVWVAEDGREIVGFISLHPENSYLDFLYVHHLHQGRGIATTLLQTLEQQAYQLQLTHITTDSSITARPFFLSKGFILFEENIKTVNGIDFLNSRMQKKL